jgi:UDP-N-acetylglucosamine 4-epimerase
MPSTYHLVRRELRSKPRTWLVTGAAGFIGSHLVEALLGLDQIVVGLDDLSTGFLRNLEEVQSRVRPGRFSRFTFHEGSVTDGNACLSACKGVELVLHQAGLASVAHSIEDPVNCHEINVVGTETLLDAALKSGVRRFVYASSSAVYGDDATTLKSESAIGRPRSPYAISKRTNEIAAHRFFQSHGLETIGLRYFNIYGPKQNATGAYAPIIPQWINAWLRGCECVVNGDGSITRDFCHVADVVQANILAATTQNAGAMGKVFNVGSGIGVSLLKLHRLISEQVTLATRKNPAPSRRGPRRGGDVLHSTADTTISREILRFAPEISLEVGLAETIRWHLESTDDEALEVNATAPVAA